MNSRVCSGLKSLSHPALSKHVNLRLNYSGLDKRRWMVPARPAVVRVPPPLFELRRARQATVPRLSEATAGRRRTAGTTLFVAHAPRRTSNAGQNSRVPRPSPLDQPLFRFDRFEIVKSAVLDRKNDCRFGRISFGIDRDLARHAGEILGARDRVT
jgi:hypothetical protein